MFKTRKSRKIFMNSLYVGLIVLIVTGSVSFASYRFYNAKLINERGKYEKQLGQVEAKLAKYEGNSSPGWILTRDLRAGERILPTDVEQQLVPNSFTPGLLVQDKESIVGRYVKVDLSKNAPIVESLLYEDEVITDDIRVQEFKLIELPSKLKKDAYVDVRIKFPTGQDYIVLSKKKANDLQNATVWFDMSEEEILTMSSAIVDAYINSGTIYALDYKDAPVQEKAKVTYPPNEKVLDLMASDPNIVKVATYELERHYRQKLEQDLKTVTPEELQSYNNNRLSNTTTGVYLENEDDNSDYTQENPLLNTDISGSTN
ncbi:SAF domain-containing protein [Bacillus sp. FSL K6-6540]|uniref:SAF domain-containing protein n=1 Tax=Bacillus sp. FSL K6-6540 TaxID=2921512 RepID=UPI0030F82D64